MGLFRRGENIFSIIKALLMMIWENQSVLDATPKTLSVKESLYLDEIRKDFPELNLDLAKSYANEIVTDYLACLETGNREELKKDCTENLVAQAGSRRTGKQYRNILFHRTVVSDYRKSRKEACLIFQTACQYQIRKRMYQTRFEIWYTYYLEETAGHEADILRCSYCGAPLEHTGEKICRYCGSEVVDTIKRIWKFSDIREF